LKASQQGRSFKPLKSVFGFIIGRLLVVLYLIAIPTGYY